MPLDHETAQTGGAGPAAPPGAAAGPLRLLVATDAWHPQVNGVVRTLATVTGRLGHARAVPARRLALHHELPHEVPGVPGGADGAAAAPRLGAAAPLPRGRRGHLRGHALAPGGARRAGL